MLDRLSTDYINSTDYKKLEDKLKNLKTLLDDLTNKSEESRKLRYAEVDIEAEREAGRLQPDELYIPQHICDTNIRREQSPYVQYITQSPRAVILKDVTDPTFDLSILENDLTSKLRYDGWQLPMFANIDGFQANGYGIMEIVMDQSNPGELATEFVQFGDFAFTSDTRDIQAVEITARMYYFTRTKLLALCGDPLDTDNPDNFVRVQVEKVISKDPETNASIESADIKDKSLYKIVKFMFRVNGVVHVGWGCPEVCDDWLRLPRPLFIGRKKPGQPTQTANSMGPGMVLGQGQPMMPQMPPPPENDYEKNFPYILFPYLISENDTISQLKGRVFLDQDLQEAVSSLISSTCTQARRASGMYFSKDVSDPNDDLMLQKNIFFRNGCVVNSKITAFKIDAPDPGMFSAINMLVSANQNETSQVNFAATNRKDSRKTAAEVNLAKQEEQILSTVQVVLFSIALTQMYRLMIDIIKSRVATGLIQVSPALQAMYARRFAVKPSGDVDVIQKNQLIQAMMQAWGVVQNTACAVLFLSDLLELMFPDRAARYVQLLQQQQQQQQSQQAQMMNQGLMLAKQMADSIISLSKKPEMFSETGKIHALPAIEAGAEKLEGIMKQMGAKPQ